MQPQPNACERKEPADLLAALIGHVDRGICLVDAALEVIVCNGTYLELFGCPAKLGVPGTPFAALARRGPMGAPAKEMVQDFAELRNRLRALGSWTTRETGAHGQVLKVTTSALPGGGFVQVCALCEEARTALAGAARGNLQRYRDYAEASSDWFWETDAELRFIDLTGRFDGTIDISREEVIGASLDDLVVRGRLTSADHAACLNAMRALQPFRDVCYAITGSKTEARALIKLSGQPVLDHEGRLAGYRGSGTDITIEQDAVRRADEIRRHLDAAIEAFSEGVALFDADDRLIFSNQCYRAFYKPIEDKIVPGMTFQDMVRLKVEAGMFDSGGPNSEALIERYRQLCRNPGQSLEVRLSTGRWVRATDRRTADGGIVSVRTDITGLKRREASLTRLSTEVRTQMMRFDSALNNMVQGLCMFDPQQRLIVGNERYLQMYGFSPDVVKPGITINEIMKYSVALGNYSAEDAERAIAERPMHAARRDQATLLQRLKDGRVIAVMHQPMPAGGSVATYEDVTERIRAEDALRAYAAKLERSNRELQAFAFVASHDLQEPLRKIEAFGARLQTKYAQQLDDNGQMYIDRMQRAASRMRTLINDLLAYSRVTSNEAPFKPIELEQITLEVISDLQITIECENAKVEVGELPEIDADPTQMRQLLQNLISNALKFKKPDVPPVVTVSGEVLEPPQSALDFEQGPSGRCEIRIADNGIGFEMKYTDLIFGIFQRLHGRNEYEGTGIGLATCRKIAERHNGVIRVESTVGEGSTFVIELPVRQSPSAE